MSLLDNFLTVRIAICIRRLSRDWTCGKIDKWPGLMRRTHADKTASYVLLNVECYRDWAVNLYDYCRSMISEFRASIECTSKLHEASQ